MYMYACMYVRALITHTKTHTNSYVCDINQCPSMNACMYVYMYVCMYVCTRTDHARTHTHTRVHMYDINQCSGMTYSYVYNINQCSGMYVYICIWCVCM